MSIENQKEKAMSSSNRQAGGIVGQRSTSISLNVWQMDECYYSLMI